MIVAQGTEAGGHCGDVSTMVLVPEVVDAVGPDVPVLAAGGIGRGRQMAAALALGAQGVWTGSIWLTVAEADTNPIAVEKMLAANSRGTVRSRSMTGKPARQLRTAWTDAWERDDTPEPLPMPLQGIVFSEAARRITPRPEPRPHRVPGRPDRRQHEHACGPCATSSSTWSRSGSRPRSGSSRSSRRSERRPPAPDPDLERIHEFTSLVIASTRSSAPARAAAARARARRVGDEPRRAAAGASATGPIAVTEVARRLEIDQSNASRQVRALEDQGLVTRTVDPDDRRVARLAITAAGQARARERARAVALNDYAVALEDWSARRPRAARRAARPLPRRAARGGDRRVGLVGRQGIGVRPALSRAAAPNAGAR